MSYPPPSYPRPQPYHAPPPAGYAHWGLRAVGLLIDSVTVAIPATCGCCVGSLTADRHDGWGWDNVGNVTALGGAIAVIFGLISIGLLAYNRWYLGGNTGQTWGRQVMRTRLVSLRTGHPVGMPVAFTRDVAHTVDTLSCLIGWLFPIWDTRRQTLADKIMTTVVLKV